MRPVFRIKYGFMFMILCTGVGMVIGMVFNLNLIDYVFSPLIGVGLFSIGFIFAPLLNSIISID
jgi:hypothetical protein